MVLQDLSSFANPHQVASKHFHLTLGIDFKKNSISGNADFDVEVLSGDAEAFVLDTRDLTIEATSVNGTPVKHSLAPPHEAFGSKLTIPLPASARAKGSKNKVTVQYRTSPSSSACQWLPPAQTAGGKRPYLFTQCQAIHARSLIPCQDCPAAKCTWSATVSAPEWATVLMSALQEGSGKVVNGNKIFQWKQPVPTSSYLVAICVGDLASRDISPRCRVWSEPSMLDQVAFEFSETEEFLKTAEDLTCPYQWTRYDVLCLPPSFPYGGMENPCLTFVTPTLLAGDRSLASVIAHEISHSWTGNLVTNETWEHFWLNEGWTVWLERRIMMRIRGKAAGPKGDPKYFDFLANGGWKDLSDDVRHQTEIGQAKLTALCPPLEGIDPDDAFSAVPYEKGFNLLYSIQKRVGDDAFEAFAKAYIGEFKFKTITSQEFKAFVLKHFGEAKLAGFDWDKWFTGVGMPPETPNFDLSLTSQCTELADEWLALAKTGEASMKLMQSDSQWKKWTSQQQVQMLEHIMDEAGPMQLPLTVLSQMDKSYSLTSSRNSEVCFRWYTLCLRSGAKFIVPHVTKMLTSQGRMKFTRPLYRELNKAPISGARSTALATFKKHSNFYHPICRKMVASDLKAPTSSALAGLFGLNATSVPLIVVVGYFAWAYWRVKNNKCPIPFVH
eukprot:CAMPEP_0206228258 /NCGR_PEP_ID=MMETSP0047_2-20121206/9075_1 /ASSEMBLY_ACC=CAM_ASM_000192 /TAXON_ID=195065 /ORGANISM="Chroomonas mesostigmatica_cf, Strain CCMP1168" /LENGTH=667 /DNA_ID=CAMNT_0053651493 /DNA_START=132 /DNA_END=2135 /DNA_ORIENTATION=-